MDTTLLEQEGMYEKWPGLKRIIKMERERTENGARSRETIYYLSSVENDEASYYAMRIRAHWGIENKLHWHLDVTFSGGYVPRTRQEWCCQFFSDAQVCIGNA